LRLLLQQGSHNPAMSGCDMVGLLPDGAGELTASPGKCGTHLRPKMSHPASMIQSGVKPSRTAVSARAACTVAASAAMLPAAVAAAAAASSAASSASLSSPGVHGGSKASKGASASWREARRACAPRRLLPLRAAP